jgi:hypothetical protein
MNKAKNTSGAKKQHYAPWVLNFISIHNILYMHDFHKHIAILYENYHIDYYSCVMTYLSRIK